MSEQRIHLRASSFDNFDKYLKDEITQEQLIEQIKDTKKESFAMNFGTYIGARLLEKKDNIELLNDYKYKLKKSLWNKIEKNFNQTLNGKLFIPEIRHNLEVMPNVILTGQIDLICGMYGADIKCVSDIYSFYHKDYHTNYYSNSWQGKLYMYLFGLQSFDYYIYQFDRDRTALLSFDVVKTQRYFDLESECYDMIRMYANFVRHNNLEEYFGEVDNE